MGPSPWQAGSRWRGGRRLWPWLGLLGLLVLVRWSKGAGVLDAYALLSRPFWPGPAQREWVQSAASLEQVAQLELLRQVEEADRA